MNEQDNWKKNLRQQKKEQARIERLREGFSQDGGLAWRKNIAYFARLK